RKAFIVQADTLPVRAEELATFERLWSREAKLQPLALLIQGVEGVEPLAGEDGKPPVRPRLPRQFVPIGRAWLLDVQKPLPELDTAPVVQVAPPEDAERRTLWRSALTIEEHTPAEPEIVRLAGEFKSSASQIADTALRARAFAQLQSDDPLQ